MAGKRAMEMSDFTSSYDFFSHGISFLPNNHWADHYQLSLELYELASQSALATGNSLTLGNVFGEVLKHGRCFEDKLHIHFIIVSSLSYATRVLEAFEKCRIILSRLGEDIPCDPSKETLNQYIQQTQSLIGGVSENELLNYKLMRDNNKLEAMKFLAKMQHITAMAKPTLHPFVTLKMVQLTILHGELTSYDIVTR
jgi:predicted ATPase